VHSKEVVRELRVAQADLGRLDVPLLEVMLEPRLEDPGQQRVLDDGDVFALSTVASEIRVLSASARRA